MITASPHLSKTTSVLVSVETEAPLWYDSVSGSATSLKICGSFDLTVTNTTKPTTFDPTTMGEDFYLKTTSTKSILVLNATRQPEEVGTYVLHFKVCLRYFPTRCAEFDTTFHITACAVTSVQVVEKSNL